LIPTGRAKLWTGRGKERTERGAINDAGGNEEPPAP